MPSATPKSFSTWCSSTLDMEICAAVAGTTFAAVEEAARDFQKSFSPADARSPFYIRSGRGRKRTTDRDGAALPGWRVERDASKKALRRRLPGVLADGAKSWMAAKPGPHAGVHDVRIHQRGRYDRLGARATSPEIVAGKDQKPITSGSGRLQPMKLTRPDNPLTARDGVKLLLAAPLRRGHCRHAEQLRKTGGRPSHPELLDYLADRFVQSGWSIKAMHRLMMLSATYQQSCENEKSNIDPENRLLYHMNRRRLEAEGVRDSLLAVAGGWTACWAGRQRRLRRPLTRRVPDDDPVRPFRRVCCSTRPIRPPCRTAHGFDSRPAKPLFLMNNPFILEQTKALAKRITDGDKDDRARIGRPAADRRGNQGRTRFLKATATRPRVGGVLPGAAVRE